MTRLEQAIVAIGALDIAYVSWVAWGVSVGSGAYGFWQSLNSFGLPYPWLQATAVTGVYFAILVVGVLLVLRRDRFSWLNYVLLPIRVLAVLPTLFPVFIALRQLNIHPVGMLALLAATEVLRALLVYRWSRRSLVCSASAAAA
jgi:hypothetical protein